MTCPRLLSIILALLSTVSVYAQNGYQEFDPDYMFSNLNTSFATTGFFVDKAAEPVPLRYFDGLSLTDSNYVNRISLEHIFNTIKDSDFLGNRIWTVNSNGGTPPSGYQLLTLDVALYRYDTLDENSIQNGTLSYIDGRFITLNNSVSPFVTKYVFAGATKNSVLASNSVSFALNLLPESNVVYSHFEIDPDDGGGFRTISAQTCVNCTYSTPGYKDVVLKVFQSNDLVLLTHSKIYIQSDVLPSQSNIRIRVVDNTIESFTETYRGIEVRARVQYDYYSNAHQLKNPFIVVEGFDPIDIGKLFTGYNPNVFENFDSNLGFTYLDSLSKAFIRGINPLSDIVYVNWDNSEADIRANAKLLRKIITTINTRKQSVIDAAPNILMGQSMGGLVSRYALTDMERDCVDHQVMTFISHDVPYHGASVPLGAMYAVRELIDYYDDSMPLLHLISVVEDTWNRIKSDILRYFDGMSARQMVYNYVDSTSVINSVNYYDLQSEFSQRGYPKGSASTPTTNIALINGGQLGMADTLATHNNKYLHASCRVIPSMASQNAIGLIANLISSQFSDNSGIWYLFLLPGSSEPRFNLDVYADNGLSPQLMRFWGTYKKKVLWWTLNATLVDREKTTGGTMSNLEMSDGSYFKLESFDANQLLNNTSDDCFEWLLTELFKFFLIDVDDISLDYLHQIMFIPTESALDTYTPNYSRHVYPLNIIPTVDSPFDAYYATNIGQYHIREDTLATHLLSYGMVNSITGDEIGETGDIYTAPSGLSGGFWGTSCADIATIDSSGELTVIRSGTVDIHYIAPAPSSCSGGNGYVCVKKRITAKADSEITSIHLYLQESLDNGNIFVKAHPLTEIDSLNWCAVISNDDLRETAQYSWTKMVDWGIPHVYVSGSLDDCWDDPYCYFPEISIMPLLRDAHYNIYMSLTISETVNNQSSTVSKMMQVQDLYDLLSGLFLLVSPDNLYWGDTESINDAFEGNQLVIRVSNEVERMVIYDENGTLITNIQDDNGIRILSDEKLLDFLYGLIGENGMTYIECKLLDDCEMEIESVKVPIVIKQNIEIK